MMREIMHIFIPNDRFHVWFNISYFRKVDLKNISSRPVSLKKPGVKKKDLEFLPRTPTEGSTDHQLGTTGLEHAPNRVSTSTSNFFSNSSKYFWGLEIMAGLVNDIFNKSMSMFT